MTNKIYNLNKINKISVELLSFIKKNKILIVIFKGDLGSGKTTLIASLVKQFGYEKNISSPTFSYLNIYKLKNNFKIYHFDLYRLDSYEEFYKAGFDDYLYQENSIVFIEWPEIVSSKLNNNILKIEFKYLNSISRKLIISIN